MISGANMILQKTKQIIIVNGALKLTTEKLVAQLKQASAGAFRAADADARKMWLVAGRPKVIARTLGEDDFYDLLLKAQRRKLPLYRVGDGTLGIGPTCEAQIEQLTTLIDLYMWVRQNALNAVPLR
jgi:peptidyl-tRNA hydrolase